MDAASIEHMVSVIIPCFNGETFILRALNSVLTQGDVVKEIIVVDDGSTDDTVFIARKWGSRSGVPVHVIEQGNRGASAARNAGLAMATGTYIQFLDADDELLPGKIASQLRRAQEAGGTDLVIGAGKKVAPDGDVTSVMEQPDVVRDVWLGLMLHRFGVTSCVLWKRQTVLDAGGWDAAMRSSQEYELMFRMMQHGARVGFDPDQLTLVHERPGASISHTNIAANQRRFVELRGRMLKHIASLPDVNDLHPYYQAMYDSLRVFYANDPETAVALHAEHIPEGFRPRRSPTTGTIAWLLHRMLGFRRAEAARSVLLRS